MILPNLVGKTLHQHFLNMSWKNSAETIEILVIEGASGILDFLLYSPLYTMTRSEILPGGIIILYKKSPLASENA